VDPLRELCGFSAALERLLAAPDEPAFEAAWEAVDLQQLGWEALAHARRANTEALEPALAEVDRRLLAVLERARAFLDPHVVTFRVAELERWQNSHDGLIDHCKDALGKLEQVHASLMADFADYIDEHHENLVDGDFALSDFVDRFGPRLAHLNTMLAILRPLAATNRKTES